MTNPEKLIYPIGVVAKILDISVHTIRLYEREGLLIVRKTDTGRRIFSGKDIERLRCIRRMILEKGLNLQGIKRIMAFIPCWKLNTNCSIADYKECPAYQQSHAPCWALPEKPPVCSKADCYICPVYNLPIDCDNIKQLFHDDNTLESMSRSK